MCNRAVNTSISVILFVPECYKTLEMCGKTADTCPFVFNSVTDQYKAQEMYDKAFSEDLFLLEYFLNRFSTSIKICSWLICYI